MLHSQKASPIKIAENHLYQLEYQKTGSSFFKPKWKPKLMDKGRWSLQPSIRGPFCGQIWLSISPIHNISVLITHFLWIRRFQNHDFIHKKASQDWIFYRLWIEGYKMTALLNHSLRKYSLRASLNRRMHNRNKWCHYSCYFYFFSKLSMTLWARVKFHLFLCIS